MCPAVIAVSVHLCAPLAELFRFVLAANGLDESLAHDG
jgi:hypothetical protein